MIDAFFELSNVLSGIKVYIKISFEGAQERRIAICCRIGKCSKWSLHAVFAPAIMALLLRRSLWQATPRERIGV